jgi:hypothetical protein
MNAENGPAQNLLGCGCREIKKKAQVGSTCPGRPSHAEQCMYIPSGRKSDTLYVFLSALVRRLYAKNISRSPGEKERENKVIPRA